MHFQDLPPLSAKGLDLATRTIFQIPNFEFAHPKALVTAIRTHEKSPSPWDTRIREAQSTKQRNELFATFIRHLSSKMGFMAGWSCLIAAASNVSLDPRVVEDVYITTDVYKRLHQGDNSRWQAEHHPVEIEMVIGSEARYDSLYFIGPKTLGGRAWRSHDAYRLLLKDPSWCPAGITKGTSPCVLLGWIGIFKKAVIPQDAPEFVKLQIIGMVDFDMDLLEANKLAYDTAFETAAEHIKKPGTTLQSAAFAGLLVYDVQNFVRPYQNGWAADDKGLWKSCPVDVSPQDWVAFLVGDCTSQVPFAYGDYRMNRQGMINAMIFLECHDLLFDIGCSNRCATLPLAQAAAGKYNAQVAYSIASFEATAEHFMRALQEKEEIVNCGFSTYLVCGTWTMFATRYRVWERFVKYTRQLAKSDTHELKALLELSHRDLMLKDFDLENDVGDEWFRAINTSATFIPRPFVKYYVEVDVSELYVIPGVEMPRLCTNCAPLFTAMMESLETEEVHAADGLPSCVTTDKTQFGGAASLAAGFRRAAIWASNSHLCCDICAGRIGFWIDMASYAVVTRTMQDEASMSGPMWMLQHYFITCVTFWPISIPFLLAGFDIRARISSHAGAMGTRDVLDI